MVDPPHTADGSRPAAEYVGEDTAGSSLLASDAAAAAAAATQSTAPRHNIGWRWLQIIGIPLAMVASLAAYWEAKSTSDGLSTEQRATKFATASQVIILGPTARRLRNAWSLEGRLTEGPGGSISIAFEISFRTTRVYLFLR